jgi:3-methylfumaryl-CoA hydratase
MWAASEIDFIGPLTIGAECRRLSRIARITQKAGRSGPLWLVDLDHVLEADGRAAIRERQTIVYVTAAPQSRSPRIASPAPAPLFERKVRPDNVMLFRYSALTFNGHRIHFDQAYATGEEGYPGLVVQGPLIATLLFDLCRANASSGRIKSFAFRSLSPAIAGEELRLAGSSCSEGFSLEARASDGRVVATARASLDSASAAEGGDHV